MGPPDTPYEGGFFQAEMTFPKDYPNHPPTLQFTSEFWHPNVYADGKVCISILHAPGDDAWGYESAAERWLPIHTVESSAPARPLRRPLAKRLLPQLLHVSRASSPGRVLVAGAVLVSVISMISSPNDESPANIDAAVRARATAPMLPVPAL